MPLAELTDVRCYYELSGQGDPLVLIPGLGCTCRSWDPVRDELGEHFTLVCLDNRGMGRSVAKRQPHTLGDYSADVVELLDHLQLDHAHVLGISLGGIIAQRFAVDHPERVNRLVLVSCAHRFGPYLWEIAGLVGQSLRYFPAKLFTRTLEILGGGPAYLDAHPESIDQKVAEVAKNPVPRHALARQLHCLAASNPEPEDYRITAPTLVISGEHDSLIPHYFARKMADVIPDSRFMLIPDAGHNPFTECPDQVLPPIIEFLSAAEPAPDREAKEQPAKGNGKQQSAISNQPRQFVANG